jgi:radical SAM superfamily enzyme YgiQ (UPF0313 family)
MGTVMRICLINPSILNENKINSPLSTRNKYFINPYTLQHIGIAYIASVLEANQFETDIIECGHENLGINDVCKRIEGKEYDAIGISAYFYNYTNVLRIVKNIRKKNPGIFLYLGGYLPTFLYHDVLISIPEVNCCVVGEGEITTLELLQKYSNGQDWRAVDGIAYLQDQEVIFTGKRQLVSNLDDLPFPKRQFMSERRLLPVLTSRGCYGHCNYCGIYEFHKTCTGKLVRRRSSENVVAEIKELVASYNVEYITFNDGNFHISSANGRKWFHTFYSLIKEANINIKYLCDFRANEIVAAKDIVEKFVEIGLYNVNVGIESMAQSQLDFYNKTTTVEQNIQSLKILNELGLHYTMGIMIFNPIATVEEILETLTVFKDIRLYEEDYNINRPISIGSVVVATTGTPLYDYVVEQGLYAPNELNYNFKYDQTRLNYEIASEWSNDIAVRFNKNYLYYIAEDHEMHEEIRMLRHIFSELYRVDLEFMYALSKGILSRAIQDKSDAEKIKDEWSDSMDKIDQQLDLLESTLMQNY